MSAEQESQYKMTSPCQAICKMDDEGVCVGCFRRKEDIDNWFFLPKEKRDQIVDQVTPLIKAKRTEK